MWWCSVRLEQLYGQGALSVSFEELLIVWARRHEEVCHGKLAGNTGTNSCYPSGDYIRK